MSFDGTRKTSLYVLRCAFFMLALGVVSAPAQVIQIQGGSSSLLDAYGGSFELHSGDSTGRFDLGVRGRPEVGFSYSRPYKGWDWSIGDRIIPFVLPTDQFSRSSYFMGRGLSLERREGDDHMLFYLGTTSLGFRTPYVNLASSQRGMELLFFEHRISPTKRFFSYNILSSRQTSLQGFEWTPKEGLDLATTAGIGANQGYWAGSLDYERDWIHIQSSYTRSGDSFHRVDVEAPLVAETTGANVRVQLHPLRWLALTMSHQKYLNPLGGSSAAPSAGVDSLGASVTAAGFNLNGSIFRSKTQLNNLHSFTVGAQRAFGDRFLAGTSYFQSHASGSKWHSISSQFRERLTRRFSLSQVVTESNGSTTMGFGGNFVSNYFSIGLEHQTFFVPFTDRAHSPFRQALMINLQLRLPHNIQLHAATIMDAFGRVRYTTYADSYFYPGGAAPNGGGRYRPLPIFIVRGIVVDEQAHPIRGAALEIDGQTIFTDSQGAFQLRVKKAKTYAVEILRDQFMFPGQYDVVSAPATVESAQEETAKPYEIILRRVYPRRPAVAAAAPGTPGHGSK
jgi:hypothetical protein